MHLLPLLIGIALGVLLRFAVPRLLGLARSERRFRGPWLELLGGGAFALIAWQHGFSRPVLAWYLLAAFLLAITATDLLAKVIPDELSIGGAVVGVLMSWWFPGNVLGLLEQAELVALLGLPWQSVQGIALLTAIWGAVFAFALLELVRRVFGALAGVDVMGMGDSKMMLLVGAFLGPAGSLMTLFLSFFYGAVFGGLYFLVRRQPHAPFGPSLALGALSTAVWGEGVLEAFWALMRPFFALPIWAIGAIYAVLLAIAVLFLVRLRRRAGVYRELIEEEYRQLDEEIAAGENLPDSPPPKPADGSTGNL